ncbi:MAG: PAS domain-containing protein, partial [Thermoanaerobaculia bacterium]
MESLLRSKTRSSAISRDDRLIIRRSPIPAAALSSDLEFLLTNEALADLLGKEPAALKEVSLIDLIEAGQRENVRNLLKTLRAGDRSVQLEVQIRNGERHRALLIARRTGRGARAPFIAFLVNLREVTNLEDDRSELLDAIEHAAWEWRRTFDAVESPIVIVG